MKIRRICELRGIISSDQALKPHFHLRRYKLFVVLIAWPTSPPGWTWEVRQKWHYLLMGANTGLRHEQLLYALFFPLFMLIPCSPSKYLPQPLFICTPTVLFLLAFIGHLRWQHMNCTNSHEHCVSLQTWGRTFWTEDSQWQNRLKNLSKDNFVELLFCRQARWGWVLAHSTVPLCQ